MPNPSFLALAMSRAMSVSRVLVLGADPPQKWISPKFEDENRMVSQQGCETYFELYHMQDSLKTRYASLNFRSTAALWLRNIQSKGKIDEWGEMCRLVHEKFGKNKYV
jgi:hypothetical protein